MARLFADGSDSEESNNLPDLDCLDCEAGDDGLSEGHVHPVTMSGTSYLYKSPVSALTIHIEHRPEKVCTSCPQQHSHHCGAHLVFIKYG